MEEVTLGKTRLGTLWKYVFPAILTNACIFLFTIVDGIFVGRGVGTDALGAVNIVMPFVMIVTALTMLTSIGGVTVTAIRLGRGDKKGANDAFMHSLILTLFIAIIVTLIGTLGREPISKILGANDHYLPMVMEYMLFWALFAISNAVGVNFQSFCRNDESPMLVAISTILTTVLNIFLDWLFVFPLNMGIKGAAIATGISQTVGFLIVLSHFVFKKGDLKLAKFKPEVKLFKKVLFIGLPEMIAQFATPITTICLNTVLIKNLGDAGVNTFAVISYICSFVMSILFGASEGLQPLFGHAYEEKNEKDMKYYYKAGIIIVIFGSALCILFSLILAKPICILFGAEGNIIELAIKYMPQYIWAFIIAGVNTLISAYLYSTKRSGYAIILNIIRSFVINIAIIIGLTAIFGGNIIWYTFGISESLVLIISLVLVKLSEKNGIVYK